MGSSPGDGDFLDYEFCLLLSFLPVDSANNVCVYAHSGKEVADTLLAVKISVSTAQGREWAA